MTEIMDLLKGQLSKMNVDGSWVFGAVSGGLTIAIPQWIYTQGWSMNHFLFMLGFPKVFAPIAGSPNAILQFGKPVVSDNKASKNVFAFAIIVATSASFNKCHPCPISFVPREIIA